MDESTHILKIQTGKQIYKKGIKNTKKITKEKLKANFFGALNINGKSKIYPIKRLNSEYFVKVLVELRKDFSEDEENITILNRILDDIILSKKEIRSIISANGNSNENFVNRILRSLKNNKNDDESTLSRKIGKHCKRESTENPDKQKEIKINHMRNLLVNDYLTNKLKKEKRIVLILDNVPAHKSDLISDVANSLNIYLLYLPTYSPDLNCVEGCWDYSKLHLKRFTIDSTTKLIEKSIELFMTITSDDSLYKTTIERYFPQFL